jgi:hypothetical protein
LHIKHVGMVKHICVHYISPMRSICVGNLQSQSQLVLVWFFMVGTCRITLTSHAPPALQWETRGTMVMSARSMCASVVTSLSSVCASVVTSRSAVGWVRGLGPQESACFLAFSSLGVRCIGQLGRSVARCPLCSPM